MNIDSAILKLRLESNLVLPNGINPGSFPGGHDGEFTEAEWNAYQWNPNPRFPELTLDSNASPKPTWAQLVTASESGRLQGRRHRLLTQLKRVCRERITEAYGEESHEDEIRLRLGNRHTEEQDAERERLRTRYSIIKAWIESTDRTLTELEGLDLTDDANWTGTEWPPTRAPL